MRFIVFWLALMALLLGGPGCSLISDLGGYKFGEDEEEQPGGPSEPATAVQTSGSGTTSSADYKLRVNVGMPQPMGAVSSDGYRAKVGPDAVNHSK